jgi:hypothetical protein
VRVGARKAVFSSRCELKGRGTDVAGDSAGVGGGAAGCYRRAAVLSAQAKCRRQGSAAGSRLGGVFLLFFSDVDVEAMTLEKRF